MNNSLFKDSQGHTSTRRILGTILLTIGSTGHIILFVTSVWYGNDIDKLAYDACNALIFTGGGLLGVGVFEKIKIGR